MCPVQLLVFFLVYVVVAMIVPPPPAHVATAHIGKDEKQYENPEYLVFHIVCEVMLWLISVFFRLFYNYVRNI